MYEHAWEERGIVRRFIGKVTGQDLAASAIEGQADARFDLLRYVINDFRDCESLVVDPSTMEEVAARDSGAARTNGNIVIAVVSDDPRVLAVSDLYVRDPLSPYPVRNFGTMDEARAWLREQGVLG